ncbi:evasin P672-like isoform X1 [Dermacentor silvarum]|uniref:evasin P672-like isoform X1 n=1 Tax=Dermacentor silvarum TaxID=543639 RepID=UPI0021013BB4|nr:evasin P672-like isoform X1 [Dermacentor silvarum]
MAIKKPIALVAAIYAMHIISGICEDAEDPLENNEEFDYSGTAPAMCYWTNSSAGLISNNCTVPCHNDTSSWNQTDLENATCYYDYTGPEELLGEYIIYNCSLGHCVNGSCIPDGTCGDCWSRKQEEA